MIKIRGLEECEEIDQPKTGGCPSALGGTGKFGDNADGGVDLAGVKHYITEKFTCDNQILADYHCVYKTYREANIQKNLALAKLVSLFERVGSCGIVSADYSASKRKTTRDGWDREMLRELLNSELGAELHKARKESVSYQYRVELNKK